MRTFRLVLAIGIWVLAAAPSSAQPQATAPLVRFDVAGTIGWVNVERADLATYDEWDHGVAQGAAGFGWYWTDHLKSEVEVHTSSAAEFYGFERVDSAGRLTYRASRYKLRSTGIALGQHYQFFRNAWVHPFVGAGVDLRWESLEEQVEPVVLWETNASGPREIEPGRQVGPDTSFVVRPFVVAGLKAYLSRRAFFRSDFRVGVHDGIDEAVARVGFGVDF